MCRIVARTFNTISLLEYIDQSQWCREISIEKKKLLFQLLKTFPILDGLIQV